MSKSFFSFPSLTAITPAVALGFALTSGSAFAVDVATGGSVTLNDFVEGDVLNKGSVLQTVIDSSQSSWAGNPMLLNSAWAHAGDWFEFELTEAATVAISAGAVVSGTIDPAFSVYTSGSVAFDGGTNLWDEDGTAASGFDSPHSFNATSQLGALGTMWMQDGHGGNMQEALGYANAGNTYPGSTGWGEAIDDGADLGSGTYASGVSWATGDNYADLVLNDLAPGFYTIFLGGANHSLAGGNVNLSVSAVPLPAAVWLFASGLAGLAGVARRKKKAQVSAI